MPLANLPPSMTDVIVPVNALHNLGSLRLAMLLVSEGVYVGSQTGRGGGINTGNMVVYSNLTGSQSCVFNKNIASSWAYMFSRVPDGLLQEVDQIWGTKFAQGNKGLGSGVDGLLENLLRDSEG